MNNMGYVPVLRTPVFGPVPHIYRGTRLMGRGTRSERARWSKLLLTLRANIYLFLVPRPLHFQLISTFFFPTSILHSLALSIPGPSLSHLSSKTDRWLGINTTRMRWETIGRMRRTRDGEAIFAPDDAQTLRSPGKLYLTFRYLWFPQRSPVSECVSV